jgi:hypothetical protein
MWWIAGSVVLVLGGACWTYFISSTPYRAGYSGFLPIAAGLIAVGVGVNQLILNSDSLWRIAGSVVLILGGGFWMFFCASMGVMVFDSPSATGGTYLNAVIPIAAPGLIAVVVGIGQLSWK